METHLTQGESCIMETCHHCGSNADLRLINKLEILADKISTLNTTMARHETTVSTLLTRITEIEVEMKPMKKHFLMVEGGLKLIGVVGVLITIIVGVFTIFH